MATSDPTTTSTFDIFKIIVALGLLGCGIFGFHYYEDFSQLYRVLALLVVLVLSLLIVYQTGPGKLGWQYIKDSRAELRKVVWPTRAETMQTTVIVCFLVVVAGLFLWGIDTGFGWGISKLLGIGS